jgi:hypothetical protein
MYYHSADDLGNLLAAVTRGNLARFDAATLARRLWLVSAANAAAWSSRHPDQPERRGHGPGAITDAAQARNDRGDLERAWATVRRLRGDLYGRAGLDYASREDVEWLHVAAVALAERMILAAEGGALRRAA